MALFNACDYLLDRRVAAGDGPRVALAGPAGEVTYGDLLDRVCRTARGLREIGVRPEQRMLMVMADSPHFVVVYLAAIRVGAIPVPVSTMLHTDGIAELLHDSRARFLAVSREFAAAAGAAAATAPELAGILADAPLEASIPVSSGAVAAAAPAAAANSRLTARKRARESRSSSAMPSAWSIVDTGTGIAPTRIAAR